MYFCPKIIINLGQNQRPTTSSYCNEKFITCESEFGCKFKSTPNSTPKNSDRERNSVIFWFLINYTNSWYSVVCVFYDILWNHKFESLSLRTMWANYLMIKKLAHFFIFLSDAIGTQIFQHFRLTVRKRMWNIYRRKREGMAFLIAGELATYVIIGPIAPWLNYLAVVYTAVPTTGAMAFCPQSKTARHFGNIAHVCSAWKRGRYKHQEQNLYLHSVAISSSEKVFRLLNTEDEMPIHIW